MGWSAVIFENAFFRALNVDFPVEDPENRIQSILGERGALVYIMRTPLNFAIYNFAKRII